MVIWLLAVVIGFTLGLLGGGGSILTVPVFVYVGHFDPKTAIAMTFVVVGVASLFGAVNHWRAGTVVPRVAVTFGAITMVGAVGGARLATLLAGTTQLLILSVAIIAAALSMLRGGVRSEAETAPTSWRAALRPALVAVGLGVGVLTGVVGVGGGFLIVPALIVLAKVPTRSAVGTSLVVIAMNSMAALAAHATTTDIPFTFVATFTAIAVVGVFGGVRAAHVLPAATLRRVFAVFLLLVGSAILYQSRGVLSSAFTSISQSRSVG
ncbi:MAG: sulfite exporter TauE/SafE family protein [Gemmatimonadetes bacterium]|nr:sulfite exporter TauE/SafE family protein [Gemmatimonadota bacterium]